MPGISNKRGRSFLFIVAAVLAAPSLALGQRAISSYEARNHVGEYSKVCGQVASTHFANRSRGAPTFINLEEPYPKQVFTALIWAEDRSKFGSPEVRYENQQICVSGVIQVYRGVPEIILRNSNQLQIAKTPARLSGRWATQPSRKKGSQPTPHTLGRGP
jgi:hypothetical protein